MKVVIADDEKWVRMTITNVIPFHQLGLNLVGEASNGIEALDMCKRYEPDILITDIRMPGLNGLELIQELKRIYPHMKIVIISGYSDFEYTKAAIKHGVSDYILKPINQSEITQVLQKVIETLRVENNKKEEHRILKDQYKAALPLMHDKVLNQLIVHNLLTAEAIHGNLLKCGIKFDLPMYMVLVFSPDNSLMIKNNPDFMRFKKSVRRIMKKYLNGVTFSKPSVDDEIISIINIPSSSDRTKLYAALSLCSAIYNKRMGSTISFGVSTISSQIKNLPDLYTQSREAVALRFWKGYGETICFEEIDIIDNTNLYISEDSMEKILFGIKFSNTEPAEQCINNVIMNFKSKQYLKPDIVKEFCWNFIQSIINRLNLQMSFIEYMSSISNINPYEKIRSINLVNELEAYMVSLFQNISVHYTDKNSDTNSNPVENAKRIIDKNYNNDISLEQVAKYIHLNPTYFSELFKKEFGMSFVDYKTQVRIENAKKLLSSTDMNIYEISSKIGYSDPKYFSKLFKKVIGMTPFEYKEKSKK